jgi:ubiquinone biosynthesis protein UbiJ
MSALFMPFIEEAGNRLLRLDPETLRRLGDLQGRVLCIEFRDLGRRLYLNLDLDWEEPLARLFGDPLGHELGRAARAAFAWHRQALKTFGLNTAEYLQEEARLLPVRDEVEAFLNGVDGVRADVDRLAARLQRLQDKLSA